MSGAAPPLLRMTGISKGFPGVQALSDARFDLHPGEVHALMGENGAGKSTLIKMLAGVHGPDSGSIEINGRTVTVDGPQQAADLGIAVIHQELNLAPNLTVAQNLALGREPRTRWGLLDRPRIRREARDRLRRVGADLDPDTPVASLSVGLQQVVEIARAIAQDARILVLDEPTAALSEAESQRLFELVAEMRAGGMGLVYISHRMEEVSRLADRVTVFRDGRWVDTSPQADLTPEDIVSRMVGRKLSDLYSRRRQPPGDVVLQARGLTDGAGVGPLDLELRAGEVVGMAGLIGAGRTETARMLFGAERPRGGEILLDGRPVTLRSPRDAVRHRIGLVPESRKEQALFPQMAIRDNVAVTGLGRLSDFGVLRRGRIDRSIERHVSALRVRCSSADQRVGELSGGNQQKVVLARWLEIAPRVLLLDEPTRGVDVGAKQEIYRIIDDLAADGVAVLVVSSDLPEVIGISDRVLVMRNGGIVAGLAREEATEETVMLHATGVARTDRPPSKDGEPR
ncbi:ribose transport system ATP-binding protein [Spinactinospora alkalitolerans]|uniref:Ribose transport system ATP-binding protein n=1 Tax=Spinactinospora alkalitolerans TaxID=687207 RepID=A0A852TXW1_9ACTN|nr:sugar ABC transporter ATP-binding protein [Spinactinospora alkalitolerans]NYE48127.1 ribose transport system ATP-binding protein [Spinactinospora alkalitolerans]